MPLEITFHTVLHLKPSLVIKTLLEGKGVALISHGFTLHTEANDWFILNLAVFSKIKVESGPGV